MMDVSLKIPRLITVTDYHEFFNIEDILREFNPRLRCKEIGHDGFDYVGVVYIGRKPNKTMIRELARKQGFNLESCGY